MPLLPSRTSGYRKPSVARLFILPENQNHQPLCSICWTWLIRRNPCRSSTGATRQKKKAVLFLVWDKNVWFWIRLLYVRSYMKYLTGNYLCKSAIAGGLLLSLSVWGWFFWNGVYKEGHRTFGDVFTVISKMYLVCTMTQVKCLNKLGNVRVLKQFRRRAVAKKPAVIHYVC